MEPCALPGLRTAQHRQQQGYAELEWIKHGQVRHPALCVPSAEAVRKVIDGFIMAQRAASPSGCPSFRWKPKQLYTNLALAIIAEKLPRPLQHRPVRANYVHYVTQTPLYRDRDEDGNVITDEDGNPRFSRANTGNFRAFLANNLRVALDTKLFGAACSAD